MLNPNSAGDNVRPELKAGQVQEFTLIMNLKPGGAERLRKKLASNSKIWKSKSSFCRSSGYPSRYEVHYFRQ
jgi:hypothetical protein